MTNPYACDMTTEDEEGNAADPAECVKDTVIRGDLLVCTVHAQGIPRNVGRVPGEIRCSCGGYRAPGTWCGEPCGF